MNTINWNDLIQGVPLVCQEIQDYQDTLQNSIGQEYQSDIRYKMLGAMRDDFASSLWIIAGAIVISQESERLEEFKRLVDQPCCDKEKFQLAYTDYIRKSVITRVYFHLDHLLGTLVTNIPDKKRSSTVFDNAKIIKNSLNKNQADIDVFSALGCTRNAFHNNGTHNKEDRSYIVDGKSFNFQKGNTVSLSWDDVSILIRKTICVSLDWSKGFPSNSCLTDN